ncbi:polyprenyl synthetase family protein [Fusobacterium gastrosuis]|uniref:polyprenyl synthetase family protein n=1 Tax=Fusobacterium gastrosuis TaxID=1755100 RepID=UPI00297B710B|nr:polyprenyl synthetase family protein [Fusobacteriaceae bacterium]MDY5713300.1 farnesyl diphosphate synthase [Fusobacterium gastrosuis]
MLSKNFKAYLDSKTLFFEEELKKELNELSYPDVISEGMKYSILNGGKRLRPILLFATLDLLGIDLNKGVKSAIALEMIHSYSLVHDDLPALDNDDYRRGQLTTHKKFGEAEAILIGDALLTHAFYLLSEKNLTILDSDKIVKIISKTALYSGINGMIGGQTIDIESENKKIDLETLKYIHSHKTGKLLKLPIEIACIIAEANEETTNILIEFSELIGLAFQVKDDILDIEGTFEEIGKPVGSDSILNKSTYPSILGMDESKKILKHNIQKAKKLILDNFGEERGNILIVLADYIENRKK